MFAEELLKAGANPEIADETGATVAMAAQKLNDPFMDALLKKLVPHYRTSCSQHPFFPQATQCFPRFWATHRSALACTQSL